MSNNRIIAQFDATSLLVSQHYVGAVDIINGSALSEKSSFKMMGLYSSTKLDWGSYIAKTNQRKWDPGFVT